MSQAGSRSRAGGSQAGGSRRGSDASSARSGSQSGSHSGGGGDPLEGFTAERKAIIESMKGLSEARQASVMRRDCLRGDFEQFENLLLACPGVDVNATYELDLLTPLMEACRRADLAVGETVILLHPHLPLLGIAIGMERGRQQNDSLADG